jgi:UDP-N-acetylglucosamine transferase subunit ALG13
MSGKPNPEGVKKVIENATADAKRAGVYALEVIEAIDRHHGQVVERLEAIQDSINVSPKDVVLREALKLVSADMHCASSRPCSTCQTVSAALGEPFGCLAFQAKRVRP